MTCDEIESGEIAEEYLLGRLSEPARAEFEAHYFDCPRCLERVELLEAAREQLVSTAAARPALGRWRHGIGAVAAAAVLVIAASIMTQLRSTPTPAPSAARNIELPNQAAPPTGNVDFQALGAITPPKYDAPRLRSNPTASRRSFLGAMELYGRADFAAAIPGLRRAIELDPGSPQAHFFLAVCYLELERTQEAVAHLGEAVRLGESPYLEDAHFFLAKAYIRQRNLEMARRHLQTVIALDGERTAEAARLLSQLP